MTSRSERPDFMVIHDIGCQCWPHVSQRDAVEAIELVALAEYRDGKRRNVAEIEKSPIKTTDVNKDTKEVLGDQQTKSSADPKGDVTAPRTEKQVVRGTIKPDKEG